MLPPTEEKLATIHIASFISSSLLGAGLLSLPRNVGEKVGTPDGWVSVLITGLLFMLIVYVMGKLCAFYPGETIYQYSEKIVGKGLGWIFNLFITFYFLIQAGILVRLMSEVTKMYLLFDTPIQITIGLFLMVVIYLVFGGIYPIASLFLFILPITMVILIIVLFLSLKTFDIKQLRPVLGLGIMPIFKGIIPSTPVYAGIEVILIISASMKDVQRAGRSSVAGLIIPILVYTMVMVVVVGSLSIAGIGHYLWPTLDMIRSFEIRGLIFERFETLFLAIWLLQIFVTIVIVFYGVVLGLSQTFGKKINGFIFGMLPVVYVLYLIPKNVNEVMKWSDFVNTLSLILYGITFLLLLLTIVIRKKSRRNIYLESSEMEKMMNEDVSLR
jgi:spore germination protein